MLFTSQLKPFHFATCIQIVLILLLTDCCIMLLNWVYCKRQWQWDDVSYVYGDYVVVALCLGVVSYVTAEHTDSIDSQSTLHPCPQCYVWEMFLLDHHNHVLV